MRRRRSIRKITTRVEPRIINPESRIIPKRSSKPPTTHTQITQAKPRDYYDVENINISIKTPELINKIKDSIRRDSSLSIVRCGDGEMHLLKTQEDFQGDKWKKVHYDSMCLMLNRNKIKRCPIHNQHLPPEKATGCMCYLSDSKAMMWLNQMKSYVISAILKADYVGLNVPHINQILYGVSSEVLQKNGINEKSLNVIDSVFTRDRSFGSISGFKNIFGNQHIHIITNNARAFQLKGMDRLLGNKITYTDISKDRSYRLRDLIKNDIGNTEAKVILFGGGAGIKDLIPWAAKTYNKVAIDVGSVLDPWSGTSVRKVYEKSEFHYLRW